MIIQGMHHSAYRCRDSEQTRAFYEDFLGLPLVDSVEIPATRTGRNAASLHSFYALADGSCLVFFEAPDRPFEFRPHEDHLHIALPVDRATLEAMREKGRSLGMDMEIGDSGDQGTVDSLYFRDPNGYLIELACKHGSPAAMHRNEARATLDRWTVARRAEPPPAAADAPDGPHALRAQNAALRSELDLLSAALERMPHGMCAFDGDDRLVLANAHYREIWSLPAEAVRRGTSFRQIMDVTPGRETAASRSRPPPEPGSEGTREREWQLDDGRLIEIRVSRRADGSCVALHEDVTEKRHAEQRISFLARHDLLTGLPNRGVLREEIERALASSRRGEIMALLCLDLDRFKPVNDTYGHATGDALLKQVALRLRDCVREVDVVARLGGDEFAVVQRGGDQPGGSTHLALRIIEALGRPFVVDGQVVHIGTSVGIAVAPHDGTDPETLQRNADLALYGAKSDGRGTLRYFEPAMNERTEARRGLENDLRRAIDEQQFVLAYQPRFDLRDGAVVGVEALLRWHLPQRGMVPPGEFIALAEETGLIVPMGRWVLEQACRDAMAWPTQVVVSVNVSAVQFVRGSVLPDVMHALTVSGLPARRLELEITESTMFKDTTAVLAALHALQDQGVRIAMDDFGTGFSSLSHLRSFPFDHLKIDRSFVREAPERPDLCAIIRGVAVLAEGMKMLTTVEGVETVEQLKAVQPLGCDAVQGFLFARPMPAQAIAQVIAAPPAPDARQPRGQSA